MSVNINRVNYLGHIIEQSLGNSGAMVGGAKNYAFHSFEGVAPRKPVLALEVWDVYPDEMPDFFIEAYGEDIVADPVKWAEAALEAGAQALSLQLKSIDPNGDNQEASQAVASVARLLDGISAPLIVWGCDNVEKDGQVLSAIAQACAGQRLVLGPVEEANYQLLAPAAIRYGHTLAASSPIDVNLAKQLNILLHNEGVPLSQILIDPTTGALGYGLEYTYSVMERLRIAALQQNDSLLALPIICQLGKEIWKTKEARTSEQDAPEMGPQPMRAIMMEVTAGVTLLLAGADIVVLSHPQSLKLLKSFIDNMFNADKE